MAEQARVTSIESLESFRASLIIFLTKARRALEEASDALRRTEAWVQHDQRVHWEGEVRKRRKILDRANQELMTARMSEFIDSPTSQQLALRRAKAAVEDGEHKLLRVKKWSRDFNGLADPLAKRLNAIRFFLDHDLPKAVAYLAQTQLLLENYADKSLPASGPEQLPGASAAGSPAPSPQEPPKS
jgi:Tfp pilus assembly protein PilX